MIGMNKEEKERRRGRRGKEGRNMKREEKEREREGIKIMAYNNCVARSWGKM